MADPQPVLPPIVANNLASVSRMLLTALGTWLVGKGVLTAGQDPQFVAIGSGILVYLATFIWAWLQNRNSAKKLVAAAATGVPTADPAAPETKMAVAAAIADPNSAISAKA